MVCDVILTVSVSRIQSDDVRVLYGPLTTLVLLTWAAYAIVFALGTKSKIISYVAVFNKVLIVNKITGLTSN